jgi:cell wall-associated NlpC family hydrolase
MRKGTILEYKRCGGLFYHYGMYIGNNKVIHRDKTHLFGHGGICITELDKMIGTLKILPLQIPHVPTEQAINTAMQLKDDDNTYNVLTNNCEHFVNYIRYNNRKSIQIRRVKNILLFSLGVFCAFCKYK